MSWAAHNVEAYDEILKTGACSMLRKQLEGHGFEDMDGDTINAFVEVIYESHPVIWDELLKLSTREVVDAEADYFASIADTHE